MTRPDHRSPSNGGVSSAHDAPERRPRGGAVRRFDSVDGPMTADGADTDTTRRRVVSGATALGIALLGAGFLRPDGSLDAVVPGLDPTPADPAGPRRSLSVSVTDGPVAGSRSPVATPTSGRAPRASVRSSGARSPDDRTVPTTVKGETVDTGRRKYGCVCGPGAKTGVNTSLDPGVVLDADATTGPGAVVSRHGQATAEPGSEE